MQEYIIRNIVQDLLRGEMVPDEEILWTGQPDPTVVFTSADVFLVPFSIIWAGFALFWELAVLLLPLLPSGANNAVRAPLFGFSLSGIPFIFVGFYITIGRFMYKKWKKKHTFYVVTNKRAMVLHDNRKGSVKAVRIDKLPSLSRDMRSDGHGTITFGDKSGFGNWYANTGMDFFSRAYGEPSVVFYDVSNANRIYELVNGLMYGKDPSGY